MKKNWYAVYTKSHCETKVAALLTKKRIENYCPYNKIISVQSNKQRMVYEPLFPCFVFVYASDSDMTIIRQVGFVINFVYWLGKPAVFKEAEIENIQNFILHHSNIELRKTTVNVNGIVKIISEPHIDINSNIMSLKNSCFQLLLPSLGYIMIANIEKSTTDVFSLGFERNKMVS